MQPAEAAKEDSSGDAGALRRQRANGYGWRGRMAGVRDKTRDCTYTSWSPEPRAFERSRWRGGR